MADEQSKELTPAPGIVIVIPDDGERTVGVVTIAGSPSGADDVSTGRVVSIGPPRGEGDPDIREMGLDVGMTLHYTKNGSRDIGRGKQVAVDHGCVLAWE